MVGQIFYTNEHGTRTTATDFDSARAPAAVGKALDAWRAAIAEMKAAEARLHRAAAKPAALRAEAERLARTGGDDDSPYDDRAVKAARKKARAAEDAAEDARLEHAALSARTDRKFAALVQAAAHHAPAWRAMAIAEADSAMLKFAAAGRMTQEATRLAEQAVGVLGMLDDGGRISTMRALPVMTEYSTAPFNGAAALEDLNRAVASIRAAIEISKKAEAARKAQAALDADEDDVTIEIIDDEDEGEGDQPVERQVEQPDRRDEDGDERDARDPDLFDQMGDVGGGD